ncbi:MAG: DMT family transporter [Leptolinea sp.]|jgi:drug/metabolite transporter (DMT)-like permease|nr:DMT family transporter [Leptolinea sp.]
MGEIAAILTAVCWSFTSIFFNNASRAIGSVRVNRLRLLVATAILLLAHWIFLGTPIPTQASGERWLWLGLSGIIGLALGDAFLFQAYVHIGARLTTIIMALDPVVSTLIAWLWLGEQLTLMEVFGILFTVFGVGWVVMEQRNGQTGHSRRDLLLGILCGGGAVLGQAIGFVLSKKGLENGFSPLSGVLIRIVIATLVMWLLALLSGKIRDTWEGLYNKEARNNILAGALVGPSLGVWLSMVSVQMIPVGIASTLMATRPVMLLPLSKWFYNEKISIRSIIGTLIALIGVTLIFLVG